MTPDPIFRRLLIATAVVLFVVLFTALGAAYWFLSRDGFRRALEAQASSWLGQPVRIGAARPRLLPRVAVHLSDVRAGEPVALTLESVDLSAELRPLLNGRIENADVVVAGSRIDMPLPFTLPRGRPAESPDDAGASPVRIESIRSIALRDIRLRSRGREIVVSADSSLEGTTLELSRFSAESGATRLDVSGTVALAPRVDARLTARANRLDFDELLALADAFSPPPAPAPTAQPRPSAPQSRIAATISADEATAGPLHVTALSGELALDGDALTLSPIAFQLFGGRYEGAIAARLGNRLSATVMSRVSGVDVARLAAFGGSPDSVTGTLTASGTFSGTGADVASLLHSANGGGSATIANGSIRRLHLIRTVVLFFGRPAPDAGASTDAFERLDVSFSLANQRLRADAFSMHSADADIAGSGTLNLLDDALAGRGDITLSEALSKQAGTDLYRVTREGSRVVLPASIGGTLSAPKLTIDVSAAAKRGIRNEIERRLKGIFRIR